mmetsp:Transcript_22853/g.65931  ORF Transcript_22853/g.65931 Transcript_22853/m.65931 type:complete len:628 (+) Transcript_22853:86-1969(+)
MSYQYSTADTYQQGYPADGAVHYGENGMMQQPPPPGVATGGVGSASSVGSGGTTSSGSSGSGSGGSGSTSTSFDDPRIADLPRILLMGPRRGGKTSIQRVVFHKMSPHETLFRLEATQSPERFVVDHTPLCRFTIWDFPGDYYGGASEMQQQQQQHGHEGYYGTSPDGMNPMMADPMGDSYAAAAGQVTSGMSPLQRQPNVMDGGGGGEGAAASLDHQQQQGMDGTGDATANGGGDAADGAEGGDAYVFGRATALIFVIDAQDEPYDHVLQNFTETVTRAIRANPHIAIEVFINKVDGELFLSDEAKYDCRRDVMQQVSDELADAGVPPDSVPISYHLTSIYDHSVFEAFSRVVQKLIPQLPTLENLLNVLVSTCSMEKAYLFDVASKLYISTDSSPVDMQSVELCSDMIDVVLDVSGIYGMRGEDDMPAIGSGADGTSGAGGEGASLATPTGTATLTAATGDMDSLATDPIPAFDGPQTEDGEASNVQAEQQSYNTGGDSEAVDLSKDMTGEVGISEAKDELVGTLISQSIGVDDDDDDDGRKDEKDKSDDPDSAYDKESSSVIRLSNGMVLYLKEVDTMLALVCLTRADNFRKRSLIDYNISCLKLALVALVQPADSAAALQQQT